MTHMSYSSEVKELSLQDENLYCLECNARNTQWASLSYGIFLCIDCASIHRSFGVRVSVVRSINMDKWTEEGYLKMKMGGNAKFKDFLRLHGIISLPIRERYKMDVVRDYMMCLKETVDNKHPNVTKAANDTQSQTIRRVSNTIQFSNFSSLEPVSSTDLRSSVSSALHKITDFVSENAVYLKDKGIQVGSKLNETVLRPSTTYLKEKSRSIYHKLNSKDDKKMEFNRTRDSNVRVKYKDANKWD